MTELLIENEQEKEEITEELESVIKNCVLYTLKYEECDFDAEVSVTLTDNIGIREINKQQRGIDAVTDVLSFPMLYFDSDGNIIDSDFDSDGELLLLGDIVISAERAREQALEYGHTMEREIAFLTVHSMLHLLGYDHVDNKEDERIMFAKQKEILDELGITR